MEHTSLITIREVHYPPLDNRPVSLLVSRLCQDPETLQRFLFLELHNTSQQIISSIYVDWCGFDSEVNLLSAKRMEPYENLTLHPGETIGATLPIPVPSLYTASVTATVNRVVFADGTQWDLPSENAPTLPNSVPDSDTEISVSPDTASLLFTPDDEQRPPSRRQRDLVWAERKTMTPEELQHRKRFRKGLLWVSLVLVLALMGTTGSMLFLHRQWKAQYANAMTLYQEKDFAGARDAFSVLLEDKQKKSYPDELLKHYGLSCVQTQDYGEALWAFGTLKGRADGDTYLRQLNAALNGIISAGERHTLGLTLNGKVRAAGDNDQGQCDVRKWSSVIAVAAGDNHSLGLTSNGTVLATGENKAQQCTVDGWKNIIGIAAGGNHSVGVRADGSVTASGDNTYNQCNVLSWSSVVAVAAGKNHSVGLCQNGTVVATGENKTGACDVADWENIVSISAGDGFTVGVRSDGTVVATGDNTYFQCSVEQAKDCIFVAAGGGHTLLLTPGGRLQVLGDNHWRQGDVSLWKKLLSVSGGLHHSAGISQDGTAYAAGDNKNGQCDLSLWKNMGLPKEGLASTAFPLFAN